MKKHYLIKLLFLAVLLGGGSSLWAEEEAYKTLTFSSTTNSAKTSGYSNSWSATIDGFKWDIANFNNNNNTWSYVKCGQKNTAYVGTITTNTAIDEAITKVVVTIDAVTTSAVNSFKLYVASDANFTNPQTVTLTIAKGDNTFTIPTPTANQYYKIAIDCKGSGSNGPVQLSKVVYCHEKAAEDGTPSAPEFDKAGGNFNEAFTLTISAAEGCTLKYTTDGSDPANATATTGNTATVSISETTTVRAIAVNGDKVSKETSATYTYKDVNPLLVDFEEENLTDYSYWKFENITRTTNTITAHGGSYYGNTSGKKTASIQTAQAVSNPKSLTCYVSKESTNTKESTWKVQVSTDGTEWTDVASQDAASVTKGSWTQFTASLSAYSNVYIRVYYTGNTAVRAIDDIELALKEAGTIDEPVLTSDPGTTYYKTITVTISNLDSKYEYKYTTDGSDPKTSATAEEYDEKIEITKTCTLKVVATDGSDNYSEVTEVAYTVTPPVANIAAFKALEVNTSAYLTLTNAQVTYVSGNYYYVEDNSGAICINQAGFGYEAGNILNGTLKGTYTVSTNQPRITTVSDVQITATEGTATPTEMTVAEAIANFTGNYMKYVKLTGVSPIADGTKYYCDEDKSLQIYNQFKIEYTLEEGNKYDIAGILLPYNTTKEIAPIVVEEVGKPEAPVFDKGTGEYETSVAVKVSNYNDAYSYLYTTDGTDPSYANDNGDFYDDNKGLTFSATTTLKMIAVDNTTEVESDITEAVYTIVLPTFAGVPTATAATDRGKTSATANWNAVEGASGYALYVYEEKATSITVISENFDSNDGTGGNDGSWSGNGVANKTLSVGTGWTNESGNGANQCGKFGSSSKQGSLTSPAFGTAGDFVLTFRAAAWTGDATTLNLSITEGTLSETSVTLKDSEFSTYTINITGATADSKLTFKAKQASKNRFFLDDIVVGSENTGYALIEGYPVDVTTTSYLISSLDEETNYKYAVAAKAEGYNNSALSNEIEFKTKGEIKPIDSVEVSYKTDGKGSQSIVVLSWKHVANVTKYTVTLKLEDENPSKKQNVRRKGEVLDEYKKEVDATSMTEGETVEVEIQSGEESHVGSGLNYSFSILAEGGEDYESYTYTSGEDDDINIPANPTMLNEMAAEGLTIEGSVVRNAQGVVVRLYDAQGRMVRSTDGDLDLTDMPAGLYIIRSGNAALKLMK